MSQNSPGAGTAPAPAKIVTLPQLPPASPAPGSRRGCCYLLPAISCASVKTRATVISAAHLRADSPRNTAGRAHASGRFNDPGNRLRRPRTWPGNFPPAPYLAAVRFWFQRVPDAATERPGGGPAAPPAPNLTHMSLKADAHVMARFGQLTLTLTSYSTAGDRTDVDRCTRTHTCDSAPMRAQ